MLNEKEKKVFLETKLRNLKRKHAKLSAYPGLTDEYFEVGKEIDLIESQITNLQ